MGRKCALLRLFANWRGGFADGNRRRRRGKGGVGATAAGWRVEAFGLLGEGFGDGIVVDGQIGQGVEYVALAYDRVDEVGIS